MKYIKTFESIDNEEKDDIFNSATLYLEKEQPISKEDGFLDCEYSFYGLPDRNATVDFYFKDTLSEPFSEENLEKFYKYLKNKRLKIVSENFNYQYREKYQSPIIDTIKISINLTFYKAEKFAEIYDAATKYNL